MPSASEPDRIRDWWRGRFVLVAAAVALAVVLTATVTRGPGASPAEGAATWVARERPAGPVLTVDAWGTAVADGGRLRVLTASPDDLAETARTTDVGSLVAPDDSATVAELRTTDEWTVTYRDRDAVVLVRDGALPTPGAP